MLNTTTILLIVLLSLLFLLLFLVFSRFLLHKTHNSALQFQPRLDGQVALISDADGSPAGAHLVRELSRRGARVIMVVRDVSKGQDLAVEVKAQTNGQVEVYQCDVASYKSIRDFCTRVSSH